MDDKIGIGKSTQIINMTGALVAANVVVDALYAYPAHDIWLIRDGHPLAKIVNIGIYNASNEPSAV
jgi:hypothetical protein